MGSGHYFRKFVKVSKLVFQRFDKSFKISVLYVLIRLKIQTDLHNNLYYNNYRTLIVIMFNVFRPIRTKV